MRPLRIALTGGIASGKSLVADMFAQLGAPVIDTDIIARQVVAPGQPALDEIRERFGEEIIDAVGELDRRKLRQRIFLDPEARTDLENILHPRIGSETLRQAGLAGGNYQLIVVPLLVGSKLLELVDRVLVVDCDEETQIRRLLSRDSETIEQARQMLEAQTTREERLDIADDVISNDGSLRETRDQVLRLHESYILLAERR